MASNNDSGVRDFDMERFHLSKHFYFPWPINVRCPHGGAAREMVERPGVDRRDDDMIHGKRLGRRGVVLGLVKDVARE
ncbi:hypothetical protein JHK85_022958 [Glycine max]|nr:hypothetical protein JHK85_022958 [Glycine max]